MKAHVRRNAIVNATALVLWFAALGWSSPGGAQTVVVKPGERSAPPPAPLVIVNSSAPPTAPEPAAPPEPMATLHLVTRPNRARLVTGLFAFGQSYIASIGIAATSRHLRDSTLWIPILGPWLDLGARPGCSTGGAGCGVETGIKVLLAADGILQTFGALEILGAFLWPETVGLPTVGTASGATFSLRPSAVGRDGYGLSGAGHF
jgi:hypothetical protein